VSEITMADVTAFRRGQILCVLCGGKGNAILVDEKENEVWNNPRPCPVCKGVGMHSTRFIPSLSQIEYMMLNYKF
jgi:hypothetical protein